MGVLSFVLRVVLVAYGVGKDSGVLSCHVGRSSKGGISTSEVGIPLVQPEREAGPPQAALPLGRVLEGGRVAFLELNGVGAVLLRYYHPFPVLSLAYHQGKGVPALAHPLVRALVAVLLQGMLELAVPVATTGDPSTLVANTRVPVLVGREVLVP